jgi:hypothetical protein
VQQDAELSTFADALQSAGRADELANGDLQVHVGVAKFLSCTLASFIVAWLCSLAGRKKIVQSLSTGKSFAANDLVNYKIALFK